MRKESEKEKLLACPVERVVRSHEPNKQRHSKCLGTYDEYNGDYDCEYQSMLTCDECKYGGGRKDPAAKCNAV